MKTNNMISIAIKLPLRYIRNAAKEYRVAKHIEKLRRQRQLSNPQGFDFMELKKNTLSFVDSMKTDTSGFRFRYSASCNVPTLYASAYACMTYSLLGELGSIDEAKKTAWLQYLDSFQNPDDGLFYDPAVANDIYADSDWWGARHLALHMISAYTDLGGRPRYPFKFLSPYCDRDYIKNWLDGQNWETNEIGLDDIDNKIMNIGCLLQYQRDRWNDASAGRSVAFLKAYLLEKINPETGIWGNFDATEPNQRSRFIQFAYHLLPLYFFDGYYDFCHERIVELTLQTQNKMGGYGVMMNSSACEDIDSADILVRFSPYVSDRLRDKIGTSIERNLEWICLNQVEDGGFVFRLHEPLQYGHSEMESGANQGAMFPTWFRTLCIARIFQGNSSFEINRASGLVF